eukprot:364115-Chlamydomonas_euryale.AAC.9
MLRHAAPPLCCAQLSAFKGVPTLVAYAAHNSAHSKACPHLWSTSKLSARNVWQDVSVRSDKPRVPFSSPSSSPKRRTTPAISEIRKSRAAATPLVLKPPPPLPSSPKAPRPRPSPMRPPWLPSPSPSILTPHGGSSSASCGSNRRSSASSGDAAGTAARRRSAGPTATSSESAAAACGDMACGRGTCTAFVNSSVTALKRSLLRARTCECSAAAARMHVCAWGVLDAHCGVHSAWSMAHGAWCTVHGAWRMVDGAWCMVHGEW